MAVISLYVKMGRGPLYGTRCNGKMTLHYKTTTTTTTTMQVVAVVVLVDGARHKNTEKESERRTGWQTGRNTNLQTDQHRNRRRPDYLYHGRTDTDLLAVCGTCVFYVTQHRGHTKNNCGHHQSNTSLS